MHTTKGRTGVLIYVSFAERFAEAHGIVFVTVGGKAPTHVAPTASIQAAIDAALGKV